MSGLFDAETISSDDNGRVGTLPAGVFRT